MRSSARHALLPRTTGFEQDAAAEQAHQGEQNKLVLLAIIKLFL
jgi:hypothetical protein